LSRTGEGTAVTIGRWLLLASLAGCAHAPPPREAREPISAPGDRLVPIRLASDVVGDYESVDAKGTIAASIAAGDGGSLILHMADGEWYPMAIRDDGTLSMPGHFGARLIRRGDRTFLHVSWAYRTGSYERRR
jgi:hypothetical protein